MLISLCATEYDPKGSGMIRLTSESAVRMQSGQRRQSKTATLDGGVVLYDTGHTLSDTTWKVESLASPATIDLIDYLCREYSELDLRYLNKQAKVSISSWHVTGDKISFNLSVLREM